jgi:hypothetical protein
MSIWAPVVAALGASALTGGLGFGTIWWQQRRADRAAALAKKSAAYQQLIAHSLSFTIRASTLRTVMQLRSGLGEGLDVAMRLRRALDPLEFHDWFAEGFAPINEAWSTIQIVGSCEAVQAATDLVNACADLVGVATEAGAARSKIGTAVKGLAWTQEQQDALVTSTAAVITAREAFITIARAELGSDAVALPSTAEEQHAELARAEAPIPSRRVGSAELPPG